MGKKGVLYVACGEKYLKQARESATSLKKHNSLEVTVYSTEETNSDIFDECEYINVGGDFDWDKRIKQLMKFPYDKNLFLDTDTIVTGCLESVFDLLDEFEVAASHAPLRTSTRLPNVPNCFPEYNAGVIAFRKSEKTRNLLDEWLLEYKTTWCNRNCHDQPSFRKSLYKSDARVATLPREYNLRIPYPAYIAERVRVLHGKSDYSGLISTLLNKNKGPRLYMPSFGVLRQDNIFFRSVKHLASLVSRWN